MSSGRVCPTLYDMRPKFGVAGGADEPVLTDAGRIKAFQVATGMTLTAAELEMLTAIEGWIAFGPAVSSLLAKGLIKSGHCGRYVTTEKGTAAAAQYEEERDYLLRRIKGGAF